MTVSIDWRRYDPRASSPGLGSPGVTMDAAEVDLRFEMVAEGGYRRAGFSRGARGVSDPRVLGRFAPSALRDDDRSGGPTEEFGLLTTPRKLFKRGVPLPQPGEGDIHAREGQ